MPYFNVIMDTLAFGKHSYQVKMDRFMILSRAMKAIQCDKKPDLEGHKFRQLLLKPEFLKIINFKFGELETLLHQACREGNFTAVKILLSHNADINQQNYDGTALATAIRHKKYIIARYLMGMGAAFDFRGIIDEMDENNSEEISFWEYALESDVQYLIFLVKQNVGTFNMFLQKLFVSASDKIKNNFYDAFEFLCSSNEDPRLIMWWFNVIVEFPHTEQCKGFVAAWCANNKTIINSFITDWEFDIHKPDDAGKTVFGYLTLEQGVELQAYLKSERWKTVEMIRAERASIREKRAAIRLYDQALVPEISVVDNIPRPY